jgi:hypothetical protein
MKQGTEFPVSIQGIVVANAVVEDVEGDRVTLYIPATRVIMGVRHELTDTEYTPDTDRMFVGQDEPGSDESEASNEVDYQDSDNTVSLREQKLDSEV